MLAFAGSASGGDCRSGVLLFEPTAAAAAAERWGVMRARWLGCAVLGGAPCWAMSARLFFLERERRLAATPGKPQSVRLCSLLRSTGQNIAVDAVRHPRNVGHPRDVYGSILDNAGRLCRHNSATRGSLDGDATLLVLVLRRRTPIAIRQLLGFGRDGCPRY